MAPDFKRLDEILRDPACDGLEFVERSEVEAALQSSQQDTGEGVTDEMVEAAVPVLEAWTFPADFETRDWDGGARTVAKHILDAAHGVDHE